MDPSEDSFLVKQNLYHSGAVYVISGRQEQDLHPLGWSWTTRSSHRPFTDANLFLNTNNLRPLSQRGADFLINKMNVQPWVIGLYPKV